MVSGGTAVLGINGVEEDSTVGLGVNVLGGESVSVGQGVKEEDRVNGGVAL